MFCTTFYSFKGGVGRTLALVNVAALLAQRGMKVLIVDFDLEAPGLTSFGKLRCNQSQQGVVDYVAEYIKTLKPPAIADYIQHCELDGPKSSDGTPSPKIQSIKLDVMSAGMDDGDYAKRLAQINWNRLYEDKHGFLLMEDMREKWRNAGYDYVLIDSRTGHTDVGGICTRQLPDAVVSVFFPNQQNLTGLKEVVQDIRQKSARPKEIRTLFAASRVPHLDDEDGLLGVWLDTFRAELKYDPEEVFLIEHYDSLMLLDQAIFAIDRPRTALAKQYIELADGISRLNIEDANGQLSYIRATRRRMSVSVRSRAVKNTAEYRKKLIDIAEFRKKLTNIAEEHPDDCILQYEVAKDLMIFRSWPDASTAIDKAIASDGKTETSEEPGSDFEEIAHGSRLRIKEAIGDEAGALESALKILSFKGATFELITDALQHISNSSPNLLKSQLLSPAIENADTKKLLLIAQNLKDSPKSINIAADIYAIITNRVKKEDYEDSQISQDELQILQHQLQLTLISEAKFFEALSLFPSLNPENLNLLDLFNSAIAKWGVDRKPDLEWFNHLYQKFDSKDPTDANYWQCRALVASVLNKDEEMKEFIGEARQALKQQSSPQAFSCWSYRSVLKEEFEAHLKSIENLSTSNDEQPLFLLDPTG